MKSRSYRTWITLVMAFVLWGVVGYAVMNMEQQKSNYAMQIENAAKATQVVAGASRLHGLLNDTKDNRTAIQAIISADVISLVDTVDAVGKTVGIELQISNVQPEPQKKGAAPGAAIPVTLSVQADGSYAQLARLIELLGAMSIPTTIQQIDLAHSGTGWHLSTRLRVLTAAISS